MPSNTTTGAGTKPAPAHVAEVPPSGQSTKPVVSLFSGLSDHDITKIMASGVLRRFPAGQTIVRADDPGAHLFLLKTGSVNYCRVTPSGQEILIIRLSPGDTFGLGTLLPKPIGYIGTAEAFRETELYMWEHRMICEFARAHSKLAENALRIALEYIRLYSDRHLALVSDTAEHRLSRMLTLLGNRIGRHGPEGLELQITNQHLASLADISSYTTSRLLNKWERKGAVEKSRGKVVIRCPEGMLA
jgi:CRP-like cAMP-binding protein